MLQENVLDFSVAQENIYINIRARVKSSSVWRDVVYSFYMKDSDTMLFSLDFKKKGDGAQAGGILERISIDEENKEKREKVFFVKTHQDGYVISRTSDFFRSPRSSRGSGPVNLKEMFVYKLFENIEIGPETLFFLNPVSNSGLLIATRDIGELKNDRETKFITTFSALGRRLGTPKIIKEDLSNLQGDITEKLRHEFLRMDLLARALNINDLNEGNYGIIINKDDTIDIDKLSVKVIDFRAPNIQLAGYNISKDTFLRNFSTANGGIYDIRGVRIPFAKTVLGVYKISEPTEELKIKFTRAKTVYNSLKEKIDMTHAIDRAKLYVDNFLRERNSLVTDFNHKMIGIENLDETDERYNDFTIYVEAIRRNISSFGTFIDEFLSSH